MHFFAVCMLVCLATAYAAYQTLDDNPDIENDLNNAEIFEKYMACFLDKGPCDDIRQSYKDIFPDVFMTACDKCSAKQKQVWKKFLTGSKEKYPALYNDLKNKYDPQGIYIDGLEKAVGI